MSLLASFGVSCLGLAGPQEPLAPPEESIDIAKPGVTVKLTHRGQRKWKVRLPNEQWQPVGTAFRFRDTLGHDFIARLQGTRLLVDTDGDGETDVTVEGKTAFLTLRGKNSTYAVRLRNQQGWQFAPGGYLAGKINDTRIRLIDQNNNGRFDDVGKDAMIVGRGKVATFLSEVVHVAGEMFAIAPSADGTELTCTPFSGKSGKLQLDCSTKGKVLAAVVKSSNGRYSFDMAKAIGGMNVPVGDYRLITGELGLGDARVQMTAGQSKPLAVTEGETNKVCWGGPVRAEFDYLRQGDEVKLSPKAVWYYGAAGELYANWIPLGASPKFTIRDDKTGKEVAQAHFPGTC